MTHSLYIFLHLSVQVQEIMACKCKVAAKAILPCFTVPYIDMKNLLQSQCLVYVFWTTVEPWQCKMAASVCSPEWQDLSFVQIWGWWNKNMILLLEWNNSGKSCDNGSESTGRCYCRLWGLTANLLLIRQATQPIGLKWLQACYCIMFSFEPIVLHSNTDRKHVKVFNSLL